MHFGVNLRGAPLEFGYIDDGTVKQFEFQPVAGMSFTEVLAFNSRRRAFLKKVQVGQKALAAQLKDADGDDEEAMDALLDAHNEGEQERFAEQIQQLLILVDPDYHEAFEPILVDSHPNDVADLLEYLQKKVVTKTADEVQTAAGVDPS